MHLLLSRSHALKKIKNSMWLNSMILVRTQTSRGGWGSNGNVLSALKASNAAETAPSFPPPIFFHLPPTFCDLPPRSCHIPPPSLPLFLLPPHPPIIGCLNSEPGIRIVDPSQIFETSRVSFLKNHRSSSMGSIHWINCSKLLLW